MYDPFSSSPPVPQDSRISAELTRLSSHYGFTSADNVVFVRGLITAVVDHVIVDRYGLLLFDAEQYEDAYILGSDTDNKWTATYPNGQVAEFRNPLYLNVGNENVVKQALADKGIALEPNQVRSAVVFIGADTSRLNLVEVSALKVKTVEQLAEILEMRYNFPPNNGQLTQADVARIAMTVESMSRKTEPAVVPDTGGSWSSDPAVVASIQVAMLAPTPPMRDDEAAYRLPAELSGHHSGVAEGPSIRSALLTVGTIIVIVLALVAGYLFFPQLQAGSTAAWTAVFILFVAIAELVAANIAAVPSNAAKPKRGPAWGVGAFVLRLLLVGVLVGVLWVVTAGGAANRFGEKIAAQFEPASQLASTPKKLDPGVAVAKRRLREVKPDVFATATNLNSPKVSAEPDAQTSYTWTYVAKGSTASATFTLVIDANGKVVSQQ